MPEEAADERGEEETSHYAVIAIVSGVVAWLLFLVGLAFANAALVAASLLGALAATVLGVVAHDHVAKSAGRVSGRGLAVAAIVLGLVHVGGWLLLPFLALLFCWPAAWAAPACTCCSTSPPQGDPCCCDACCDAGDCCGDCCDCGCGDCACGACDCGCGGCGCGGCLVLAPRVDAPRKRPWRDALAHHPDHPAFEQDVYRVAGLRLCVGCFTTIPLFFLATAALLALPPAAPWWGLALAGVALALAQAVSSAGLAKKRWMKVGVKASLGVGMALLVRGVLDSPLAPLQQAGVLLVLVGLSAASALPRRARIRRALA